MTFHHYEGNPADAPFMDPFELILERADLNDKTRAELWDAAHSAKTPAELAQKLQNHPVSNEVKHALWEAKSITAPTSSNVEKVTGALQKLKAVDPDTLALAEKFPNVTKAIINAASGE